MMPEEKNNIMDVKMGVLTSVRDPTLTDHSFSLSLPRETVEGMLCTSPSNVIPCMTASDVSRNIDSQTSLLGLLSEDNQNIILEDDEFFLDVPPGTTSTANLADAVYERISANELSDVWNVSPSPSNTEFPAQVSTSQKNSPCGPSEICSSTAGAYNFNIALEPTLKKKANEYIFKTEENCLYVKPFVFIPFMVQCSHNPPPNVVIRVCAFYAQGAHASQPVKRCPHHLTSDTSATREHFIIAESASTTYIAADEDGGRPHIVVPFPYAPAPPFIPLQFRCYSSCNGGINRRPLLLCFSLELNGESVGHRQMSLKVCACPSRDAAVEGSEPLVKKRRTVMVPSTVSEVVTKSNGSSRNSFAEDDDTVYEVQIRGRHLYKLVCSIVSNYELSRRYQRENCSRGAVEVDPLVSASCPLNQRTAISTWLANLKMQHYEHLFAARSLFVIDDLEGVINKKFLQMLGISETDISVLLNSYLSWFDVYNAQRQSTLSSHGSSIRIQRTRLCTSFRRPD